MFNIKIKKGDIVKINLLELQKNLNDKIFEDILKFNESYKNIHTVTNIYKKNMYTNHEVKRYELDNEYVFYENELIKIKNGRN